jgi:hypothetical protein
MSALAAIGRFSEIMLACSSRVPVSDAQYIRLLDSFRRVSLVY